MVGKPFEKGQSGNPGGRPKGQTTILELARTHAPEAIETLVKLMRTGTDASQVAACDKILDRAYGKPAQHSTVDASVTNHEAATGARDKLAALLDRFATAGATSKGPGAIN